MSQIKIEFEKISIEADLNNSETANRIKKIKHLIKHFFHLEYTVMFLFHSYRSLIVNTFISTPYKIFHARKSV